MFNTSKINVKEGGKYISPGVQEVVIDSIEGQEPENRASYLEIKLRLPESDEATPFRFYMGKGEEISLDKLTHMATKVVTKRELDKVEANDLISYGAKLNKLLSGKRLRMKFISEEYLNSSGEKKVKPSIPYKYFAEAVTDNAEYPAVPSGQSRLIYDPNNKYDFKKLEGSVPSGDNAMINGNDSSSTNKNDDLPF